MFTPLILFLGLTVATAVIAYWSDNLGKKLGKKRVTLMGLRPRTTATILTITSSWAIMLFTLAVLLAVVTPLRHALFRYDRERAQYKTEISAAQTSLSATRGQLTQTRSSLSQSNQQLSQAASELANANTKVKRARQETQKANVGAQKAQAGARSAQLRAKSAQNRALTAQRRETTARNGEQQAEALKKQATQALSASRSALQAVQAKFISTQNSLNSTQVQLKDVETRLRDAKVVFVRVGKLVTTLGPETIELQGQRNALTRQRESLQKQVADLEVAARIYQQAALQLAGGDVNITVGKTFAARIIEAGESPQRIEAQLREILAQGETAFEKTPETAPFYRNGARLILLQPPGRGASNDLVLKELAQVIALDSASKNAATSVRLVAKFNFTAEEKQIAVQFIAVPAAVAFGEGETLASATIESAGGDAGVFKALNNLIEMGRKTALKRKVNPPQSLGEPDFYASGTTIRLFEALRRIEASGQAQRVNLVAAEPLSTVEPLRVRFEVEGAPTS